MIKLNSLLSSNSINAIFKFSSKDIDIYNYKGINVSGSHLVLENNKWIRVETSKYANKIKNTQKYIYCLETSDNKIETNNNIIFADYEETLNKDINLKMMKEIFDYLNNNKLNFNFNDFYLNGFHPNSNLLLNNLQYKKICNIKIGDVLCNNSKVIGVVKRKIGNIKLFKYKRYILSGMDIVKENNLWIPVCKSSLATEFNDDNIKILYHIQEMIKY